MYPFHGVTSIVLSQYSLSKDLKIFNIMSISISIKLLNTLLSLKCVRNATSLLLRSRPFLLGVLGDRTLSQNAMALMTVLKSLVYESLILNIFFLFLNRKRLELNMPWRRQKSDYFGKLIFNADENAHWQNAPGEPAYMIRKSKFYSLSSVIK